MQRGAERVMPEQLPVEMITAQSTAWSGAAGIITEQQKLQIRTQERQEGRCGRDLAKLVSSFFGVEAITLLSPKKGQQWPGSFPFAGKELWQIL